MLDIPVETESARTFADAFTAFSQRSEKLAAYATIHEEIGSLRNTIQQLEKHIFKCQKSIIRWKSRHNAISDISRLPDEILIEIWKNLAFQISGTNTRWLGVTHVCSRWRRIALECPTLWSWPCLNRPEVASRMIERAGASEITLIVNAGQFQDDTGDFATQLTSSVLPRTKAIVLMIPPAVLNWPATHYIRNFLLFLRQDNLTNKLRHLEIHTPQNTFTSDALSELDPIHILQKSPQLQSIYLTDRNFFLSQSRLASPYNLTSLKLCLEKTNKNQQSSPHQILQRLRYLPNLKDLWLVNAFKPAESTDKVWLQSNRPVNLPELTCLRMEAGASTSLVFLLAVQFPLSTLVEVQGLRSEEHRTPEMYSKLLMYILQRLTDRTITPSLSHLEISHNRPNGDWLLAFGSADRDGNKPAFSRTSGHLRVWVPPSLNLVAMLPRLRALRNLRSLDYQLPFSITTVWKRFGLLRSLEYLTIHPRSQGTFLRVLASIHPSGETVFESWNPKTGEALYYNNIKHIQLYRGDRLDALRTLEEYQRIELARQVWESSRGQNCGRKPE